MRTHQASRNAVLVCQGRAAAHRRVVPDRFSDPTAMTMLRDDERVPVDQVRAGTPPQGAGQRIDFEMVRASAEVMVPRTIAIDDAVRARLAPQLVILGAGLDGRAWRMAELAEVDVYELDHPASQQDKRERAAGLQPLAKSLRYVPVDFTRDRLDRPRCGRASAIRAEHLGVGRRRPVPQQGRRHRHRRCPRRPIGTRQLPDRQLPDAGTVGPSRTPSRADDGRAGSPAQPVAKRAPPLLLDTERHARSAHPPRLRQRRRRRPAHPCRATPHASTAAALTSQRTRRHGQHLTQRRPSHVRRQGLELR